MKAMQKSIPSSFPPKVRVQSLDFVEDHANQIILLLPSNVGQYSSDFDENQRRMNSFKFASKSKAIAFRP